VPRAPSRHAKLDLGGIDDVTVGQVTKVEFYTLGIGVFAVGQGLGDIDDTTRHRGSRPARGNAQLPIVRARSIALIAAIALFTLS